MGAGGHIPERGQGDGGGGRGGRGWDGRVKEGYFKKGRLLGWGNGREYNVEKLTK